MTTPRLSVLMPVYNTQRHVGDSVRSILAQTFTDFEFIIIDDGSTDDSPAILRRFADDDARIRLISRPNTGYGVALNEGLGLARGQYLARLDSDDLADPRRLELQVAALDADPSLVAVGSCAYAMDEAGDIMGDYDVPLGHEQIEAAHLQGQSGIHHPGVTMRTEAVRRVGGYRVQFVPCEDFDLWLRLGEVGRLANLPQKLLTKRLLVSGAVVSGSRHHATLIQQIMDDAWARRGLPGRYVHQAGDLQTPADFFRQWAWMALRNSNRAICRRYAWKALCSEPWRPATWRLAYCAVRGR